jgi:FAD/FMN-containing dehydrogenases
MPVAAQKRAWASTTLSRRPTTRETPAQTVTTPRRASQTAGSARSAQDSAPAGPATDSRADYDHTGGAVERPALVADLSGMVAGEVRFDEYTRELYATDASAYEVTPVGVVFPRSTDDVAAVVEYCALREIPVLPRGGGTSLAGQAVNEAVVLDFTRHMDAVLDIDPGAQTARAQPGVLLGDLNAVVGEHGLKFAPTRPGVTRARSAAQSATTPREHTHCSTARPTPTSSPVRWCSRTEQ